MIRSILLPVFALVFSVNLLATSHPKGSLEEGIQKLSAVIGVEVAGQSDLSPEILRISKMLLTDLTQESRLSAPPLLNPKSASQIKQMLTSFAKIIVSKKFGSEEEIKALFFHLKLRSCSIDNLFYLIKALELIPISLADYLTTLPKQESDDDDENDDAAEGFARSYIFLQTIIHAGGTKSSYLPISGPELSKEAADETTLWLLEELSKKAEDIDFDLQFVVETLVKVLMLPKSEDDLTDYTIEIRAKIKEILENYLASQPSPLEQPPKRLQASKRRGLKSEAVTSHIFTLESFLWNEADPGTVDNEEDKVELEKNDTVKLLKRLYTSELRLEKTDALFSAQSVADDHDCIFHAVNRTRQEIIDLFKEAIKAEKKTPFQEAIMVHIQQLILNHLGHGAPLQVSLTEDMEIAYQLEPELYITQQLEIKERYWFHAESIGYLLAKDGILVKTYDIKGEGGTLRQYYSNAELFEILGTAPTKTQHLLNILDTHFAKLSPVETSN